MKRSEEKVTADSVRDQKDIRIRQLLSEIEDMGEVKAMTDNELERVREMLVAATSSSGESAVSKSASIGSSNESALIAKIEQLQAEKRQLAAEEFDEAIASGEAERKAVRALQRQLAESRVKEATAAEEKRAVERRLDEETEAKLETEDKLEDLQKRIREKQIADRLSDTSSSSESNASDTEALRTRVRELEAERMLTMDNFRKLERKLADGQSSTSIGDEMNYLRNKQVQSLIQEIELLEKAVDSLTDENEVSTR